MKRGSPLLKVDHHIVLLEQGRAFFFFFFFLTFGETKKPWERGGVFWESFLDGITYHEQTCLLFSCDNSGNMLAGVSLQTETQILLSS